MPKVSFIVAVYNSMPFLTQCLDSLLGQTVKDIEVICVNDCSPDNSAEVIQDYIQRDPRVRLINHTTNKRQGGAWNSGVQSAAGEYLCFVDADDWLEKNYCEVALKNETADIILARRFYRGDIETDNIKPETFARCGNDLRRYLLLYGLFFITNFYKRELFLGFQFVENNMYHDFMTDLLYFKTDNIFVIENAGYHYRVDNISTQRSKNNNSFWGRLEVAILEYNSYASISSSNGYREEIDFHFYSIYYINTLIRAFWGYTTLHWDIINQVKKNQKELLPNIKNNPYYSKRFETLSFALRFPIYLFELCPRWLINIAHKIYWIVRGEEK